MKICPRLDLYFKFPFSFAVTTTWCFFLFASVLASKKLFAFGLRNLFLPETGNFFEVVCERPSGSLLEAIVTKTIPPRNKSQRPIQNRLPETKVDSGNNGCAACDQSFMTFGRLRNKNKSIGDLSRFPGGIN